MDVFEYLDKKIVLYWLFYLVNFKEILGIFENGNVVIENELVNRERRVEEVFCRDVKDRFLKKLDKIYFLKVCLVYI